MRCEESSGVKPVALIFVRSRTEDRGRGATSRPAKYSSVVTGVTSSGLRPRSSNTRLATCAQLITGPSPDRLYVPNSAPVVSR